MVLVMASRRSDCMYSTILLSFDLQGYLLGFLQRMISLNCLLRFSIVLSFFFLPFFRLPCLRRLFYWGGGRESSSGWHGGPSTQEDVSELFTFLVCLLRCPALPLSEALFHGGTNDVGDSRISTERALYLALPEEKEMGERERETSLLRRIFVWCISNDKKKRGCYESVPGSRGRCYQYPFEDGRINSQQRNNP